MTGVADNKRIVTSFFDTLNKQGFPDAIGSLPIECTWWSAGKARTQPEMAEMVAQLKDVFAGPLTMEILNITAEEDRVAVEAQSSADLTNGRHYRNSYVFLFFLENGKVTRIREHADTFRAAKAFG